MKLDLHCHIDLYDDPFKIASEAIEKKVYVLSVTTTPKAWNGTIRLEQNSNYIRTALGFHPQLAKDRIGELSLFDSILPKAKYVGEIGLDGSKEHKSSFSYQIKAFKHILSSINKCGGRIMSIHSKNSASHVLECLKGVSGIPILHWFSGTISELESAVNIGCWFSVNTSMTNSKKGIEIIKRIPDNRILPETDGPFIKINREIVKPWDTNIVIRRLAEIKELNYEEISNKVDQNMRDLLSIDNAI